MGILNSLKRRLNYVVVKPLLYNQELADAYSGTSVVYIIKNWLMPIVEPL